MVSERLIYLIDDDSNILSSLKRLLKSKEYSVFTFTNGNLGLKALEDNDVAILVTDYNMPEISGIEVLKKAREISPDTIRVMITGALDIELALDAISHGEVYRIIQKPWNDLEFMLTIEQCFEKYNLIQENYKLQENLLNQTKVEMVRALIVTLNHEINNSLTCLSICIEQISCAQANNQLPDNYSELLKEMKFRLNQMAEFIKKLKNIEEIKMTEYIKGTMMIDHRGSR